MEKIAKGLSLVFMCLIIAFSSMTLVGAVKLERAQNLKASAVTYNSVILTWSKVPSAKTYQVQMNSNDGKGWKTLSNSITKNIYTVTGLTTGKKYTFRVRGNAGSNYGTYSTTIDATPSVAKVTGVKATTASITSAKLSWSKVSGASGYQIQKYENKKWTTVANTKNTSYTIKNLKAGTSYTFRVRAYRTVSDVKKYGTASSTVKYTAGVGKVSGFKIASSTYNSASVSWSKMSGVTGYQVYKYDYSNTEKGWYKVKTITSAGTVKYSFGGLVTGTKYAFKVRAYYKTNSKTYYGSFTSALSYTPKLNTVSGIKLTSMTNTKAVLTWNTVPGAEGYQIYDYATGSAVKLPTVKTNKTTINLENGKQYKIKIRAYTKKNGKTVQGSLSSVFSFYSVPANVKNLKVSILDSGYAKFTWDKTAGADGYNLYVKEGTAWRQIASDLTTNSYILKDVSLIKDNVFMLRAYIKSGDTILEGANSNEFVLTVISAPTVITGESTDRDIALKWNAVNGANGYIIERYDYNSESWGVIGETTEPAFTDNGFEERGSLYRVYGVLFDTKGNILTKGIPSEAISATTSGIEIKQSNCTQTIKWPKKDKATKYRVIVKGKTSYYTLPDTTTNSITTVLTPDSVILFTVCAYDSSNTPLGYITGDITFKTKPITVLPSTHSYYDESVNSQLLYLVDAINNSKTETGKVEISSTSSVSYTTDKFYLTTALGTSEFKGDDIQGLLNAIGNISSSDKDELEKLELSNTETVNETLKFNGGIAKNSQNQSVNIASFIEPSNKSFVRLYDWENPSAWRNGFSSVKTTPLSNGGYRFELTLKKEKFGTSMGNTVPLYHPCFTTTVASLGYLTGSDASLENELSTVGDTVITATVNPDGTLDDYTINSPYTMKIKYKVDNVLVDSFGMYLTGNIISDFKFTR